MKISKILDSLNLADVKTRVLLAHRLKGCSPSIKTAIINFIKNKTFDNISVSVDNPKDGGYITLSSTELVEDFGMKEMEALLYLDSIIKANTEQDKANLSLLLGQLSYGNHRPTGPLSEEMMKNIEHDHPDVWREYVKLCKEEEEHYHNLENEYQSIVEEDV